MRFPTLAFLLLTLLAVPGSASDPPLRAGDRLPSIKLDDQHGRPHRVDTEARQLVFSADRAGGRIVRQVLSSCTAGQLRARGVAVVADLGTVPAPIAHLFVLPGLREAPYPILVDPDGEPTRRLPERKDEVTLVRLERGRIVEIVFADRPAKLAHLLTGDDEPGKVASHIDSSSAKTYCSEL